MGGINKKLFFYDIFADYITEKSVKQILSL